ncbi:MAG: hypothetical protein V1902_02400 [Candidatus Falkowbacteria bacterium]
MTPDQVTVFLVPDMDVDVGCNVAVFVDGLFDKPERTDAVRKQLADVLARVMVRFAEKHSPRVTQLVECIVRPFCPQNGFAALTIGKEAE